MNTNINNQHLEYSEEIISKIKEMIKNGLDKLKSFVKYRKPNNLKFYNDLKENFKKISAKLQELKLCEELKYFISISPQIEYIVYQNCLNPSFGHCSFAIELMDFYNTLIETNFSFYLNENNMSPEEFKNFQKEMKIKNISIAINSIIKSMNLVAITPKELYELHASLKE